MYTFEVSNSDRKNKKLKIIIYKDGVKIKTLHVGDNRYSDYIQYYRSNPTFANERKFLYLQRHNKEKNDMMSASWWSKKLLWSKKTLEEAIADIIKNSELKYNKIKI